MAGLYIHIPFCVKKCDYCDFVSFTCHERIAAYIQALQGELRLRSQKTNIDTVFIGGGTPSVLPPSVINELLETVRECFILDAGAEISMECNPGTADIRAFEAYLNAGINRLSIGVQSFCDELLAEIGRIHTAAQAEAAVLDAKNAGFGSINLDVMYGLPGQARAQHASTLERCAALGVEHVSAYSLILEDGTPLYRRVQAGAANVPDEDETYELHRLTVDTLPGLGYARYEISNYAKPGHECRHNLNYWDNGEYIGVGVAAHSAQRILGRWVRSANTASLEDYIGALQNGTSAVAESEDIPPNEEMFEYVMLGLRKTRGIALDAFLSRFGTTLQNAYPAAVKALLARDWLHIDNGFAYLNDAGLDMQNAALLSFLD